MGSHEALLVGASVGLAIAAPIGPTAIVVIRRTLVGGFVAGMTTGAGASTIHLFYSTLALDGLDQIGTRVQQSHKPIDLVMALSLVFFAIRLLRPRTMTAVAGQRSRRSLMGNYASALALSGTNPMMIVLLLSALTAFAGSSSVGTRQTVLIAAGVFAGSLAWWLCLVGTTALIGIYLPPRSMRVIDTVAGLSMVVLAASALARIL